MRWNQRKIEVLGLVEQYGEITSSILTDELKVPLQHASWLLRHYYKPELDFHGKLGVTRLSSAYNVEEVS